MKNGILLTLFAVAIALTGCRGYRTEQEPIHLNPNFDWQAKVKAQTKSLTPPEGTVAWGTDTIYDGNTTRADFLKEDSVYYRGKTEDGAFVAHVPVQVTRELVLRGQERFNIYCAVCHNRVGTGKTPVILRGFVPPPDLADARLVAESDGYIFDVASNGIRNMPAYRRQINEADRWAIVTYVRVLQKARNTNINDVPDSLKSKLE
jgi:hypothetical protein